MPVDQATADALDALALQIFDFHIVSNPNPALGYTTSGPPTGVRGNDPAIDQKLFALLSPVILAIDGHPLERAPYTLNMTMALKLRKKKWYLRGLSEMSSLQPFPVSAAFEYEPSPGMVQAGNNSGGFTLGAAICAVQCKIWARTIRNS